MTNTTIKNMANNERLFARANSLAIKLRQPNEALRSLLFLEGWGNTEATFKVEYNNLETNEYREIVIKVEVKPLNYKEQMVEADTIGISATELKIAQEVNSWGVEDNVFQMVCNLVSETYYDTDVENDIWYCTKVIVSLYRANYTLDELLEMSSWARIDAYEELC